MIGVIADPSGASQSQFGAALANIGLIRTRVDGTPIGPARDSAVSVELIVGAPGWSDPNDAAGARTGAVVLIAAHAASTGARASPFVLDSTLVIAPATMPGAFNPSIASSQFVDAAIGHSVELLGYRQNSQESVVLIGAPGLSGGTGGVL